MDVLFLLLRSHRLWQSRLWPVGDAILSAEGSQERECLVDAFVQHLSLGMKSLSAKASQERECLVGAFVQHLALGMKSCLQRVRKSVNVLLTKSCLQRPRKSVIFSAEGSQERDCHVGAFLCAAFGFGDDVLSAEGSQERGCLVGAFAQPRVVAEWALAAWECLQERECLVRGFVQPPVMAEWVVAVWGDNLVCRMFAKSVNILLAP